MSGLMQTSARMTPQGLALTITGCTIANLGNIVPAFFGGHPDSSLTLTHAADGTYTVVISSYPVPFALTELITALQGIESVTGG